MNCYNICKMHKKNGFTLLEIAIVILVIGIIISISFNYGKDILFNAWSKKLIKEVDAWYISIYSYLDLKGRFPGDGCKNGIMTDNYWGYQDCGINELVAANTPIAELVKSKLSTIPPNPVVMGSTSIWVYIGHDDNINSTGRKANVIVLCCNSQCGQSWGAPGWCSRDQIEAIEILDTTIDGNADAGKGSVRAITWVNFAGGGDWSLIEGRYNGRIRDVTAIDETPEGSPSDWLTGNKIGAVYMFERKY